MKRRRTMLLYVTASSVAAAVSCQEPAVQPVGMVAQPGDVPRTRVPGSEGDGGEAVLAMDAGRGANQRDTALPPMVGTTARVPDAKKP